VGVDYGSVLIHIIRHFLDDGCSARGVTTTRF
jgi:hypothetical protein